MKKKIIKLESAAKINLTLEITGKLPDRFHTLRSIMYKTENLYDEIGIIFSDDNEILITCDDESIPTDEKNICWQIAESFFTKTKKRIGLNIEIKKRIPAMAGLGGGSSNGAAVLLALNDYFEKPLKFKELVELAAEVGKDIPFFLQDSQAVYVSGKGEKLASLEKFPKLDLLIINPQGEIGTRAAYQELDRKMWFMGDKRRKNISKEMAKNTNKIENLAGYLYNDFEIMAEEKFPIIKDLKNCLITFGALGVSLTGKGPTIFGIFKNKKAAMKAKKILVDKYPDFFLELG